MNNNGNTMIGTWKKIRKVICSPKESTQHGLLCWDWLFQRVICVLLPDHPTNKRKASSNYH